MDTQVIIVAIIVAALILVAIGVWYFIRRRRSQQLQQRFGPEYQQMVRTLKDRDVAEAELRHREKRVSQFHIVPLSPEECTKYQHNWIAIQSQFVDQPKTAVADATRLVEEVMERRGYPMAGFEQSAADLSVDHPAVVENYRAAHRIAERSQRGGADTEELRQAVVHYRALFQDLLGNGASSSDKNNIERGRERNVKVYSQ
jgi:uncharacterized protein YneF (UPF0154 family)